MDDATAGLAQAPAVTRVRPADAEGIAEAVALLDAGGIVAIPTETVYGLAADAARAEAVSAVFAAKGRPTRNPLIVHVADRDMAGRYARFGPVAERLAAAFWPGPLTLVLRRAAGAPLAPAVSAGLATVAVRVPAHPVMQGVVRALGRGVAAPSANASGRLSPTTAGHVTASLAGRVPLVLDAGPTAAGLESSIVGFEHDEPVVLREGAIPREALEAFLGARLGGPVAATGPHALPVVAPGMLLAHYAPLKPLRLDAVTAEEGELHIGFGPIAGDRNLSASGNLAEAARALFAALHAADAGPQASIAVAPIPREGLGAAINDRLARAAQGAGEPPGVSRGPLSSAESAPPAGPGS
jgi:L-threonylcarbamoyladenylate synthase